MSDALKHAQYLEGFFISEDVPAYKAREIAKELRSQAAEITRLRAALAALQHAIVGNTGASAILTVERMRAALAAQVPQPVSVPEAPALDWPQMLMLINAYAGHVADAAQHQAASRADISHAAALKALTDIRMAMAAHTSRWQALVHELIWRASPPAALAVPDGWALVPVAETKEMKAACLKATNGWWDSRAWPAMLASSPQAPADTQAQGPNAADEGSAR